MKTTQKFEIQHFFALHGVALSHRRNGCRRYLALNKKVIATARPSHRQMLAAHCGAGVRVQRACLFLCSKCFFGSLLHFVSACASLARFDVSDVAAYTQFCECLAVMCVRNCQRAQCFVDSINPHVLILSLRSTGPPPNPIPNFTNPMVFLNLEARGLCGF